MSSVTWDSYQGGDEPDIFAQRFDATGTPVGAELQVNDSQTDASVCCDAAGNFAVVWQSDDQDGSSQGVFGQLFDARANAVGAELQVNTYTTNQQGLPDVACDGDGDLFVVWRSLQQDGSDFGVFGRFLDRVRNTSPVPAASGLGLAALAAALTAIGIRRLLRRR